MAAGIDRKVVTVNGEFLPEEIGICDAHNHVWIDPVPDAWAGSPLLNDRKTIQMELAAYREAGGCTIVDCQPGGCGRNGNELLELSLASDVKLIACTGFHRARYYSADFWLWNASEAEITPYFIDELSVSLIETKQTGIPVRAGFIKVACEATIDLTPHTALDAAIAAATQTGAAVEVHTEQGADAENIAVYFIKGGLTPDRVILCHMDKRPNISMHVELAKSGFLLEYDTFFRSKYDPENNLWKLLESMAGQGFCDRVALATDMAESSFWKYIGGGPGLESFPRQIRSRLVEIGLDIKSIELMMGGNIAARLARPAAVNISGENKWN